MQPAPWKLPPVRTREAMPVRLVLVQLWVPVRGEEIYQIKGFARKQHDSQFRTTDIIRVQ